MYVPPIEISAFFEMLNQNGFNYLIIKNISNELPCSLDNGKYIDILVHAESKIELGKGDGGKGF